jgi:transposase
MVAARWCRSEAYHSEGEAAGPCGWAARRETAAKLIEDGMSQRQAAKALGVGKGTIQRDLVDQNGPQSGPERSTKAERRAQRERELASKRM